MASKEYFERTRIDREKRFIERLKENNPNLTLISKYNNAQEKVKYYCKVCGYEN